MQDNLQNLGDIFDKKVFRIPDYQRGYSWEERQLNDFWGDLDLMSESENHYTGMITYRKIEEPKDDDVNKLKEHSHEPFYIVDGQQRIITILILLKCILNKFGDNGKISNENKKYWEEKFLYKTIDGELCFLFGYEKDDPSDYHFKNKILEKQKTGHDEEESTYTRKLSNAKKFFERELKNLKEEKLEKIFEKLTNQLKFNIHNLEDDFEEYVTFETINFRGKRLSTLELLKNRLIYLSTKIEDSDDLRKDINNVWKTIYEYLGKNPDKLLNEEKFLENHCIFRFYEDGYKNKNSDDYLLKDKFTIKNVKNGKLTERDIKIYIDNLEESIKSYFFILNPAFESERGNNYPKSIPILEKLNRLETSYVDSFLRFSPLLISAFNKEISDEELSELLHSMEVFTFVLLGLTHTNSNYRKPHFHKRAYEFQRDEVKLMEINREIEKEKSYKENIQKFGYEISDKFRDERGFFDWKGLRYFLIEYELYLGGDLDEDSQKQFIFSQNQQYPQFQNSHIYYSLGNLVLSSNSRILQLKSSRNFPHNCGIYKDGSLSEKELCDYGEWREEEVKHRGLKLLDFMSERWEINFKDEEEKLKLLRFDLD